MATRSTRSRATKVEPEEVIDLVQHYQEKALSILEPLNDGIERKPWEYARIVGEAQVYATMANTEAVRAWYAGQET